MEVRELKSSLGRLLVAAAATFAVAAPAKAETIIKFAMAEAVFDVSFDGTTFGTVNDGNGATAGDQDTNLDFNGFLAFLPDINNMLASFSLDNVVASGLPTLVGPVVSQATTGGTFAFWDDSNNLLLAGTLNSGVIVGSTTATTGSFFNTTFASFTGGSLAALVDPTSAGLSLALASITSQAGPGLAIGQGGVLLPFAADAAGLAEGRPIPEPMTAALLLSGVALGGAVRRRKSA